MTGSVLKTGVASVAAFNQPWLKSATWDTFLIAGPAFISSAVVLLFREQMSACPHLPLWAWVSFVLCVDVAHVYATLFRTYFDKSAVERNGTLLVAVPLLCWAVGALLYSVGEIVFWRVLAYLAVFHFVRQQYGFVVLYSRKDGDARLFPWLDHLLIYAATIYPLLFWHSNMPRNFVWFVEGDFWSTLPRQVADVGLVLYGAVAGTYLVRELFVLWRYRRFNVPRNLIIGGTALSWWTGIITVNSDLAFTMTNVITHGIPYMALIWLYHKQSVPEELGAQAAVGGLLPREVFGRLLSKYKRITLSHVGLFVLFLIALAYLEEGLWAGLIWREHLSVFGTFAHLPAITDPQVLAILVPFLALPQSTHYALDGFIWRVKDRKSIWSA